MRTSTSVPARRALTLTTAVLSALTVAAPAQSAGTWATLTMSLDAHSSVATTPHGTTVGLSYSGGEFGIFRLAAGGVTTTSTGLNDPWIASDPKLTPVGDDDVAIASYRPQLQQVEVRSMPAGDSDRKPDVELLPATQDQDTLDLAGNARGDVALVAASGDSRSVWLRRTGQARFRNVLAYSVGLGTSDAVIDLGARGDLLLAWEASTASGGQRVFSRYRDPRGVWWPVERVGTGNTAHDSLQVTLGGDGRRTLLWRAQGAVRKLASASGKHHLADAVTTLRVIGRVGLAAAEHGDPIVAWREARGAQVTLRVAGVRRGGLSRAQTVTTTSRRYGAWLVEASVANSGAAIVAWNEGDQPFVAMRSKESVEFGEPDALDGPGPGFAQGSIRSATIAPSGQSAAVLRWPEDGRTEIISARLAP